MEPPPVASPPPLRIGRYAAGVVVVVGVIVSQYVVPGLVPASRVVYGTLVGDLALVYGVPVVVLALLLGSGPLRRWRDRMGFATVEGLRWYGLLSLLALLVTFVLAIVYAAISPATLDLLRRPNPALTQAAGDPWLFVGLSFLVGAAEETIFRGWLFGFFRAWSGSWLVPATGTSVLFAGVHLYYGTTYGAASPLIFPNLFLMGLAFAVTYRVTGGNLVVVALLHGAHDAFAFVGLVSLPASLALEWGLVLVGALVALVLYLRGPSFGGRVRSLAPPWP